MAADMTYAHSERNWAAAWKRVTDTLPADAQVSASYIGNNGHAHRVSHDSAHPVPLAEILPPKYVRRAALSPHGSTS